MSQQPKQTSATESMELLSLFSDLLEAVQTGRMTAEAAGSVAMSRSKGCRQEVRRQFGDHDYPESQPEIANASSLEGPKEQGAMDSSGGSIALVERILELHTLLAWMAEQIAMSAECSQFRFDPDDLVQEVYKELLRKGIDNYDPTQSLEAYLYGMLRNISRDWARRARRQKAMPPGYDIADDRFNPYRMARKAEKQRRVRDEVNKLRPRDKRSAERQMAEIPIVQAAAAEGVSIPNMYLIDHRARERLRGPLDDCRDYDS